MDIQVIKVQLNPNDSKTKDNQHFQSIGRVLGYTLNALFVQQSFILSSKQSPVRVSAIIPSYR